MWRYIGQRLLWIIAIIFCVAIIIFTIMYFVPGDPAAVALGNTSTEEQRYEWREMYGLNDSYIEQLGSFLSKVFLKMDLGTSYTFKTPVMTELGNRIPRTVMLGCICLFFNAMIGIPLGVLCALHRNSPLDSGLMVGAMAGVSIPDFWLALLMVILFSLTLGWLPAYGIGTWKHWVMPVIAGSIGGIAINARQTRSAVLETMRADFVTTARAKGLKEFNVVYKHMLPNALLPVVGMLGSAFARCIAGTVVIETVFSFPGVGTYLLSGISSRDYPIVRGCVLVLAIFAAFSNLLVDLIYAFMDPRIKAQYVAVSAKKGGGKSA
ncbi:MAG: ABC transporter permease [Lachnospiraceae bacterium]|nr:ABC transporter permease [Lachnospiraceae bacterium]